MGYCIKLISYKEIKEEDVKSIIFSLPDYLRGPLDEVKEQTWGWPCVCDIHKPNGKELMISGAYVMSSEKAQEFTSYIQIALDKMGYDTCISYYVDAAAGMAEKLKDFNEKTTTSFKHAAEAMSNFGSKAADLIKNGALKDSCSHCGEKFEAVDARYCEDCYQKLIAENAQLQLKLKNYIPNDVVDVFMNDLRWILIQPHEVTYTAEMKLRHILELYLRYIPKLGGIKNESDD